MIWAATLSMRVLRFLRLNLGPDQIFFGRRRRQPFVPERQRKRRRRSGPRSEPPGLARFLPFFAPHVKRQSDDESHDAVFAGHVLQVDGIHLRTRPRIDFQRRRDPLLVIGDGNSDPLRAEIEPQQAAAHRDDCGDATRCARRSGVEVRLRGTAHAPAPAGVARACGSPLRRRGGRRAWRRACGR